MQLVYNIHVNVRKILSNKKNHGDERNEIHAQLNLNKKGNR